MRQFANLFRALEQTTATNEKVAALQAYFSSAPAEDAAWALHFLLGRGTPRAASTPLLMQWVAAESRYPVWLVEECRDAAGDLAETLSLLMPETSAGLDIPLHRLVDERILQIIAMPEEWRREVLTRTWREMDGPQRLVFNKLITGSFRVGVARGLVVRALAGLAQVESAVMDHRLMMAWKPNAEDFRRLLRPGDGEADVAQPYPFFLASPLTVPPSDLGALDDWLVEWKWDGLRAQIIRRQGQALIWSRGEEMVSQTFPEITEAARVLDNGAVLDGEILAWRDDRPLSFGILQRRIGRKEAGATVRSSAPVIFLAFDVLELGGKDVRLWPLRERRAALQRIVTALGPGWPLRISPSPTLAGWEEAAKIHRESRARGVEGLMFKRWTSAYQAGRVRGDWWKWKIDPYVIDAVLIYAQQGHGRRAGLFTDYTFGVWHEGELVPVAKAYSGLNAAEIAEVDSFVRRNTTGKFGPVRVVKPELVFELAFEGLRESTRHRAGIALRFPRMNRWRKDKKPPEADQLETLRRLL